MKLNFESNKTATVPFESTDTLEGTSVYVVSYQYCETIYVNVSRENYELLTNPSSGNALKLTQKQAQKFDALDGKMDGRFTLVVRQGDPKKPNDQVIDIEM